MEHLLLFFIFESLTLTDALTLLVTVIGALWLWKSGLPQQLFQSSSKLVELRTIERDDAIKDRDKWKSKYEDLDKQMMTYREELAQRIEINILDREKIRELEKNK
jgi:hypothetical protein